MALKLGLSGEDCLGRLWLYLGCSADDDGDEVMMMSVIFRGL